MADMPLLKKILIAAGADVPEGLGDDVTVIDPSTLDEATLAALQAAAGGGEEAPPSSEDTPPAEGDEAAPTDEVDGDGEPAPEQSVAEIQQSVGDKLTELQSMAEQCAQIAEAIPDAADDADKVQSALDEAQSAHDELMALAGDDDPAKASKLADTFEESYQAATEACESCKAFMPDLEGGEGDGEEGDAKNAKAKEPTLADWADRAES